MKCKYVGMACCLVVLFLGCGQPKEGFAPQLAEQNIDQSQRIEEAFRNHQSDVIVSASAVVEKILEDDVNPSRHQRFIVRLDNDLTLLMSHNIDLAPRVDNLKKGDEIFFQGEYEYNPKGGVVHWTHHDPKNYRPGGWIEYNGQRYQ